jgi:hypothetical protein
MVRNGGKRDGNRNGTTDKLEREIDSLFRLPLAEFTGARNTLAARLKKEGHADDAERVKLLSKPSVSAWAVNQLYWDHRDAFDELIATSKDFRPASSRLAGRVAGMRDSLDARRDALTHLSELAEELFRDAGHNPTPDMMRRVVTTLESLSAYALLPDGPTPGRLTHDVDPPSFESLALLMSGGGRAEEPVAGSWKSGASAKPAGTKTKSPSSAEVRRIEEFRQKKIAAAKAALQDAKKSLTDARGAVQSLEATQKKANADVKEAEKYRREAESLLEKATAKYEDAVQRAKNVEGEIREAAAAVEDAKGTVEETTKELESLLRGSPRSVG